jgi:hypothetical protein
MRSLAKIRTGGAAASILALSLSCAVGTSRAQDQALVINEQIQLGDVFSSQTLNVEEAPEGLSVTTTAVGNIVSAIGQQQPIDFQSDQQVDEHVEAVTNVTVAGQTGEFFVTQTAATGNSATAGTCCALTLGSSFQTMSNGSVVAADAISSTGDMAGSVSVDASAVGNTQGWNQIGGEVQAWTEQRNMGLTQATNSGEFVGSAGNIGLTATAVANNVTIDAENAYVDIGVNQSRQGPGVMAVVDATIESGTDVQSVASASGNLVDASVSSPNIGLSVVQNDYAGLDAYSSLTLTEWSGDANSVAYGVGNSIIMSNVGAATSLYNEQSSEGEINATAAFTGGTGKAAFISSTAMGNAVSGYSCTECGGDFGGFNRQVNGSKVRSQSNVSITGRTGLISAESTAIGNTANYEIRSSQ